MYFYYLFTALVLVATISSFINEKLLKWPPSISVLVFSLSTAILTLSLKEYFPDIASVITGSVQSINFHDLLMKAFLGFILFAGAFRMSVRELKEEIKPVLILALFSTVLSSFVVGYLLFLLLQWLDAGIPFLHCLLFGALISPTDPVAVLGLFKKIEISQSLKMKINGESLFNDGVAIVLFTCVLAAASPEGGLNSRQIIILFFEEVGGGVALGLLLSLIGFFALRAVDNFKIEILITVVLVMVGYSIGDHIDVSAPIAVVIAGLFTGSKSKKSGMSDESKQKVSLFWDLLDDFLNLILFLLIGFEVLVIPRSGWIYAIGCAAILIVLFARFISVSVPMLLFKRWFGKGHAVVLTWCALRGGVSIALALSIPSDMHRSVFVIVTYLIAVFSIVVQGLTIRRLIERLQLR